MRITNGMMQTTVMNSLYGNMNKMNTLYAQMSSMKKIQRPSDDPIIAGRSLKLKLTVLQTEQHTSNVQEANSWMDTSETALSNIQEILKDIRTRCNQGANDSLTTEDRNKIIDSVVQLQQQLQHESNTTYAGRYLFSGFKTDQPMYCDDPNNPGKKILNPNVNGQIDGQVINYEVGVGNTIGINTLGVDKLMSAIDTNIEDLVAALNDPTADLNDVFSTKLGEFDKCLSDVSSLISDLGSKQTRLDYTQSRLIDDKTSFTELLANTEDVDIEQVYTDFNAQYMVYQSALQAASKLISNTLGDFLR